MNKLLRNKKNICRALLALAVVMLFTVMFALPAMAEEGEAAPAAAEAAADNTLGMKALAAGLAVGIAAAGGAFAMRLPTPTSAYGCAPPPAP